MEQERSNKDEKRKTQLGKSPKRSNIEELFEVRSVHSSDKSFVMKEEQRG